MAVGLVGSAYAHKSQTIGDYTIEVGWDQEPPIVGQSNAIVVNVSMASADEKGGQNMNMTHDENMNMTEGGHDEEKVINGISGLSDKIQADVSLNGKKKFLTLEEDPENLGHYTGDYTPMETGFPLVHIVGKINDQDLEVTFHPEKIEKEGEQIEETHISGMSSDGTVHVDIDASVPKAGEPMSIHIKFTDMDGNPINHINHDITAIQDGSEVLSETGAHHHEGEGTHMTKPLTSDNPVDIQVKILGIGLPDADPTTWTGPKGDVVSLQVVPEFGQITMMIFVMAVVSIIAITAKTRIIPRSHN